MHKYLVALLVLPVLACGLTSGSTASPAPTVNPGHDCRALTFPFPPADVDLGARDNGKTARVRVGGLVAVALIGQGKHWTPIQAKGSSLVRLATPAQAATVGTQLGEFCAVSRGSTTMTSGNESGGWMAIVEVQ